MGVFVWVCVCAGCGQKGGGCEWRWEAEGGQLVRATREAGTCEARMWRHMDGVLGSLLSLQVRASMYTLTKSSQ
jgi:hypothetical protein